MKSVLEPELTRQSKAWVLLIKACAVLMAVLNSLILGWSLWTLFTVPADDLSLTRPFASLFLLISTFMLVFCWRLFLQRLWAAVCVCLTGWAFIVEMLSRSSAIASDPAWLIEIIFTLVIFTLSLAVFTARNAWKRAL
jgi:hypothetical protein